MLRDHVKKYYLEQRRNCAESVLRAANEAWDLGLTDKDFALFSGFGGGMGCGKTCGALSGSLAALGAVYPSTKLARPDGIKTDNAALVAEFAAAFAATCAAAGRFFAGDGALSPARACRKHFFNRLTGPAQSPGPCWTGLFSGVRRS